MYINGETLRTDIQWLFTWECRRVGTFTFCFTPLYYFNCFTYCICIFVLIKDTRKEKKLFYLTLPPNGGSHYKRGRVGRGCCSGPVASGVTQRWGAFPHWAAPRSESHTACRMHREGQAAACSRARHSKSPWTLCFLPFNPQASKTLREHGIVERTWVGNQEIDPIPTTSAHFLVGSFPNSSEAHSAHLWKKAAGLDLDNLEGPGQP